MKKLLDRLGKNLDVVKGEWKAWAREMKSLGRRLSRPSLNPANREHFVPHVLVAVVEETYDQLPRNLTYLTVVGVPLWLLL